MDIEAKLRIRAMTLGYLIRKREFNLIKIGNEGADRIAGALGDAYVLAVSDPGAVVRVSFDTMTELLVASRTARSVIGCLDSVSERCVGMMWELQNGSAIVLTTKDDHSWQI